MRMNNYYYLDLFKEKNVTIPLSNKFWSRSFKTQPLDLDYLWEWKINLNNFLNFNFIYYFWFLILILNFWF